MCNADMPDDQMDQHKTDMHPEAATEETAAPAGDQSAA